MDYKQEQARHEQLERAERALQLFMDGYKHTTFRSAVYFLKGYTQGKMCLDDAILIIERFREKGYDLW